MIACRFVRLLAMTSLGAGMFLSVAPASAQTPSQTASGSPAVDVGRSPGLDVIALNQGGLAKALKQLPVQSFDQRAEKLTLKPAASLQS